MAGTIIVTGGGRGIGAAISRHMAGLGHPVLVNYASDEAAAAGVVASIEAAGGRARACRADVADPAAIAAMFATADRELGPLAGLVNNAGILGPLRRIDEVDVASLTHVLAVNVVGAMLCAGEAVRRLSTKHGGPGGGIVTVGSVAATSGGIAGMAPYATSKGAVASFTIALAKEVAREGVRVNAVAPGMIVTDLTSDFAHQVAPNIPMGRCGEPDEVAASVAWLLSAAASYVHRHGADGVGRPVAPRPVPNRHASRVGGEGGR